jgi:hypothetical protein
MNFWETAWAVALVLGMGYSYYHMEKNRKYKIKFSRTLHSTTRKSFWRQVKAIYWERPWYSGLGLLALFCLQGNFFGVMFKLQGYLNYPIPLEEMHKVTGTVYTQSVRRASYFKIYDDKGDFITLPGHFCHSKKMDGRRATFWYRVEYDWLIFFTVKEIYKVVFEDKVVPKKYCNNKPWDYTQEDYLEDLQYVQGRLPYDLLYWIILFIVSGYWLYIINHEELPVHRLAKKNIKKADRKK